MALVLISSEKHSTDIKYKLVYNGHFHHGAETVGL